MDRWLKRCRSSVAGERDANIDRTRVLCDAACVRLVAQGLGVFIQNAVLRRVCRAWSAALAPNRISCAFVRVCVLCQLDRVPDKVLSNAREIRITDGECKDCKQRYNKTQLFFRDAVPLLIWRKLSSLAPTVLWHCRRIYLPLRVQRICPLLGFCRAIAPAAVIVVDILQLLDNELKLTRQLLLYYSLADALPQSEFADGLLSSKNGKVILHCNKCDFHTLHERCSQCTRSSCLQCTRFAACSHLQVSECLCGAHSVCDDCDSRCYVWQALELDYGHWLTASPPWILFAEYGSESQCESVRYGDMPRRCRFCRPSAAAQCQGTHHLRSKLSGPVVFCRSCLFSCPRCQTTMCRICRQAQSGCCTKSHCASDRHSPDRNSSQLSVALTSSTTPLILQSGVQPAEKAKL